MSERRKPWSQKPETSTHVYVLGTVLIRSSKTLPACHLWLFEITLIPLLGLCVQWLPKESFILCFLFVFFPGTCGSVYLSMHNTTIILVSLRSENFLSTTNILNHFHVVYVCIYLCLCFAFYTFKYLANPCGQSSPKWLQDYSRLKKFLMVCPILWTYTWMLEIFTAHCTRKVCATETRLFCMTAIVNDA